MSELDYKCLVYYNEKLAIEKKIGKNYGTYTLDNYCPIFNHMIFNDDVITILFYSHGKLIKRINYLTNLTYPLNPINYQEKDEEYYVLGAFI